MKIQITLCEMAFCGAASPSAVLVLGEHLSLAAAGRWELFEGWHGNTSYFRDVRNPWESKPFAGPAWLHSLRAVTEVLPLSPPPALGPCSGPPKFVPRAGFCGEAEQGVRAGREGRYHSADGPLKTVTLEITSCGICPGIKQAGRSWLGSG